MRSRVSFLVFIVSFISPVIFADGAEGEGSQKEENESPIAIVESHENSDEGFVRMKFLLGEIDIRKLYQRLSLSLTKKKGLVLSVAAELKKSHFIFYSDLAYANHEADIEFPQASGASYQLLSSMSFLFADVGVKRGFDINIGNEIILSPLIGLGVGFIHLDCRDELYERATGGFLPPSEILSPGVRRFTNLTQYLRMGINFDLWKKINAGIYGDVRVVTFRDLSGEDQLTADAGGEGLITMVLFGNYPISESSQIGIELREQQFDLRGRKSPSLMQTFLTFTHDFK